MKKVVNLVLGADFQRIAASLPLLEWLKENQIEIELFSVSGGGGIIASLWQLGYSSLEIKKVLQEVTLIEGHASLNWFTLYQLFFPSKKFKPEQSLYSAKKVISYLKKLFKDKKIEELPIPIVFHCTDYLTGNLVKIQKGLLWEAIYASSVPYPHFPPLKMEDRWLVSGLFSAPLPIEAATKNKDETVIALTVETKLQERPRSFYSYSLEFIFFKFTSHLADYRIQTTLSHEGEIHFLFIPFSHGVNAKNPNSILELEKAGKIALEEQLPYIQNLFH